MKRTHIVAAVSVFVVALTVLGTGWSAGHAQADRHKSAAPPRFESISEITTDHQGNVYLADNAACRVEKLSPSGKLLMTFGKYSGCFGGYGMHGPYGVALDSSGNVWATNNINATVTEYSPGGRVLRKWGSPASGAGVFGSITSIGVSPAGEIALGDVSNHAVKFFTPGGKYLRTVGGPNLFSNWICSLAWDAQGNLYVCDTSDGLIRKFSAAGKSIAVYGKGKLGDFAHGLALDRSGTMYVETAGMGIVSISPKGKVRPFSFEGGGWGIAVDPSGNIWASGDSTDNTDKWPPKGFLQKFSHAGSVLLTLFKPR
jgi:sugar lactone lactonase YvrE